MKVALLIVGILALVSGLMFAGQGLGYIDWPARSTMLRDMNWAYYGSAIAVVGLVLIVVARRR